MKIVGAGRKVSEGSGSYIMRNFIRCTFHQILGGMRWAERIARTENEKYVQNFTP